MGAKRKPILARQGRFAYEGLDRVIHEKARLGILTSLAAHPGGLLFNDLKALCSLTDGNLNRHLAVLEEELLVVAHRSTLGGRPQTVVALTRAGRRRFQEYLDVLEQVLSDAAVNTRQTAGSRGRTSTGFSPAS